MGVRYGMVGGGEGAFIGAVHRMAARLDDSFELVCGAFSSDPVKSYRSGAALGLPPERVYGDFSGMMAAEAALPANARMQCVVIASRRPRRAADFVHVSSFRELQRVLDPVC